MRFEPDSDVPEKHGGLPAQSIPEVFGNGSFSRDILKKYPTELYANKAVAVFSPTEISALHIIFSFFRKQMENNRMLKKKRVYALT